MIKKYVKKPVIIEAVQYTGTYESFCEIQDFVGDSFIPYQMLVTDDRSVGIKTSEGNMIANVGDYIIEEPFDKQRKFYPCKPDIFEMTYEETL
jgi:hypothetical protein